MMGSILVFAVAMVAALMAVAAQAAPIRLHPANPHYFLWRGKPTVLIGSGEHYGAVLNLDFDYVRYLATLKADGPNHTRMFSGVYCEPHGAFGIARNTLAPAPGRYIAPWARSDQPGYGGGGNRFDLTRWDPAYFARLKDFLKKADGAGVVVEINLFCPFYEDAMWRLSPMNAANNVNNVGAVDRTHVYTLDKNGGLLAVHEAVVRKIVTDVNRFDNLYFEICNEPYFGGVTMEWQRRIADVIVETERSLPRKHLISMNIANGSAKVEDPHPGVSILNFHYASPPDAVAVNHHLGRVIGDNETGFKGTGDTHYRMEAWEFILAGGGLFSHLDYSFVAGHEDGTFEYPASQPGGGNPGFRRQMKALRDFISGFDFVRMQPDRVTVKSLPRDVRARTLSERGRQYAIYLFGKATGKLVLDLPAGKYEAKWVETLQGAVVSSLSLNHRGGDVALEIPAHGDDIALSIKGR